MVARRLDITGQRYGRLIAIEWLGRQNNGTYWLFRCDCGNTIKAELSNVRRGHTQSCGCICTEVHRERLIQHGGTRSRLFRIWNGMMNRCERPGTSNYTEYGGRGIRICREWLAFPAFRDWAEAHSYADDLTIERKDNNGPYSPENCRWATRAEQCLNKRDNRLLTLNGKTQPLAVWVRETGINRETIKRRLQSGWSIEEALTIPPTSKLPRKLKGAA